MKFAIAFVALFAACQASAVYPYVSYASHAVHPAVHYAHAPITQYSSYPAHHVVAAPAPISYAHHVAAPAAVVAAHSPLAYAHAAPHAYAHYAHAPVVVAKAAASYTAANRGSVHTAPLPGHAISQTSLNLAPAPGTL